MYVCMYVCVYVCHLPEIYVYDYDVRSYSYAYLLFALLTMQHILPCLLFCIGNHTHLSAIQE